MRLVAEALEQGRGASKVRVGPEGAVGLREAAGPGGDGGEGESEGVGMALGVHAGGAFVQGLGKGLSLGGMGGQRNVGLWGGQVNLDKTVGWCQ